MIKGRPGLVCLAVIVWLPFVQARGQEREPQLAQMVLDCAMHEEAGPWVPKELRAGGVLRFNYFHQTRKVRPGPYDYEDERPNVYVIFWDASKKRGEFLDFSIDSSNHRWLTISNEGEVDNSKGTLQFDFFQGGFWMRDHYLIRVRKLLASPVQTIALGDVKRTGALCDSFLSPHLEWQTQSPSTQNSLPPR